jgi:hypothetical protein
MRGITYGLRITKARCRTPRKIKRISATGSSARGAFVWCIGSPPCSPTSISNSIAGFFAAVALGTSLNLFLRIATGTIAGFPRESLELGQWHRECAMRGKQIKFQSDSVMAGVYLGVTVAGLYTLVGMGLIIAFM